jgi:hypothetical protein
MRKVLILGLLAAAAAVPSHAMAQDVPVDASREQRREARQERRAERRDARREAPVQQPRAEQREDRQERREERREARQEAPVQQQRAERREDRQERRQERQTFRPGEVIPEGAWIGNPNDPRMEEHRRRYERIARERARDNGTQEQYRAVIEQQRQQRGGAREDRREDRQEWRQDRREDRQEWRQDRREDRRDWNRDWRRDQRYDWQRYRQYNRNVYRGGSYYAPYRGYSYNRFSIGVVLDRLFWGRNYWISDPWQYRLPPAPYGYQWVRYYNDVILVDTYNGRVVDVIHDFFW